MSLNNPKRCGEEVELFAQAILQVALVGKVQSGFASSSEDDEGGRAHADLRHIFNVEARDAAFDRGGRAAAARLRNGALEKVVQLRSRNTTIARLVRTQSERQKSLKTLPRERGDCHHRCPIQKLHLVAQSSLKRRRSS